MTSRSTVPLLVLAGALGVATACGGKDSCELLFEQTRRCEPGLASMKADFIADCKTAAADPVKQPRLRQERTCAQARTCELAETCRAGQLAKRQAAELTAELAAGEVALTFTRCGLERQAYLEPTFVAACDAVFAAVTKLTGGAADSIMTTCDLSSEAKQAVPAFAKACGDLARAVLTDATAAAIKARDDGTNVVGACSALESIAKQVGGDAPAKATALCDEALAAFAARTATP